MPPPTPFRALSAEERMLVELRDTLYEGSWEDFAHDLAARMEGQPHVFEIVPDTPHFAAVIRHHLGLIQSLDDWEREHQVTLRAKQGPRD